jgi:acetyl-CoA carboxylase alpha subunit
LAKKTFLDFEQPVAELEAKIEELRYVQTESAVDITLEIDQLSKKKPATDQRHLQRSDPLADHQNRPSPRAPLHTGLHQRHLY